MSLPEGQTEFFRELSSIAGLPALSGDSSQALRDIEQWLKSSPQPAILARLAESPEGSPDWTRRVRSSFASVRDGLRGSAYHLRNMARIEENVIAALEKHKQAFSQRQGAFAGCDSSRLDFEYQAFLFALRRTLEYCANAIGSLAKTEIRSFRTLPKKLPKAPIPERDVVDALVGATKKAHEALPELISAEGARDAARDHIAHRRAVPAGQFSLITNARGGHMLVLGEDFRGKQIERIAAAAPFVLQLERGTVTYFDPLCLRMRASLDHVAQYLVEVAGVLQSAPV